MLSPNFEYDVFISYAHADDLDFTAPGWIHVFARKLQGALTQSLARTVKETSRQIDVYWDHRLDRGAPLTQPLKQSAEKSALFVIIMSEKYLASPWCHQELDWFAATIDRQRKNTAPIVVEVGPTERSKWPKPLQDVPGFTLYDKDCREARDPCFAYPNPEVTRSEEAARKAWLSRAA